jgi:hypothetical protein
MGNKITPEPLRAPVARIYWKRIRLLYKNLIENRYTNPLLDVGSGWLRDLLQYNGVNTRVNVSLRRF